jgi:hypothetical protein
MSYQGHEYFNLDLYLTENGTHFQGGLVRLLKVKTASNYEGGEALSYQPEVSNWSFEVSQQLSTHKMKMNKKLMVLQALHI